MFVFVKPEDSIPCSKNTATVTCPQPVQGRHPALTPFILLSRTVFCPTSTYNFFLWRCGPTQVMASSFNIFLDHTQRRATVGRTPLESQRPLPDNTQHSQQTDIHAPAGFEPTILAGERPQTYALDRAATGTCIFTRYLFL